MEVEHIVWDRAPHEGRISGILELEVFWHGGGEDVVVIQGTFDIEKGTLRVLHQEITFPGSSGILVKRVGRIVS